jgi:ribosomal protein S21
MTKTKTDKSLVSGKGPEELDFSYFKPLEVRVYDNNFERAFKTFKALVQFERILSVYKERQSYEKPSEKKRRKHGESIQKSFELDMKKKKIKSGEYEKEKQKKLLKKEQKLRDRSQDD